MLLVAGRVVVCSQLCEVDVSGNFLFTWFALSLLGLIAIILSSGVVFKKYYWRPTYEQWVKYVGCSNRHGG